MFRNATWLACGCHTKGVKDSDLIIPGLLPSLLSPQHLLLSARVETRQQNISLLGLSDIGSESAIQTLEDFVVLSMSPFYTEALGRQLGGAV